MKTKFSKFDTVGANAQSSLGDVDKLDKEDQYSERFRQDTKQRKVLVRWMMWVVSIWLAIVLFCTIVGNILCLNMDKQVLITLLATTTINVLGLANIILKGLFGHKSANKKK
jgi:hypothetical protein